MDLWKQDGPHQPMSMSVLSISLTSDLAQCLREQAANATCGLVERLGSVVLTKSEGVSVEALCSVCFWWQCHGHLGL